MSYASQFDFGRYGSARPYSSGYAGATGLGASGTSTSTDDRDNRRIPYSEKYGNIRDNIDNPRPIPQPVERPESGPSQEDIQKQIERDRRQELRRRAEMQFQWLPAPLFNIFRSAWVESGGDAQAALAEMRQDRRYNEFFPGNARDDGTVRLQEQDYISTIEAYEQEFASYGVPVDIVEENFSRLIEGNVRPTKLADRLEFLYSNVASQSNEIQQFYAQRAGINVSQSAILSSFIRRDMPIAELEQKVRQAHIGGTAMEYDFDIAVEEARRLEQFGLDRAGAQRLYSTAATQLPRLQELVQRHNDPDDDFSLEELTDALIMEDPDSLRRVQRLFGQERSQFAGQAQYAVDQRTGGITGLRQR